MHKALRFENRNPLFICQERGGPDLNLRTSDYKPDLFDDLGVTSLNALVPLRYPTVR